jgi:hypothetical protein
MTTLLWRIRSGACVLAATLALTVACGTRLVPTGVSPSPTDSPSPAAVTLLAALYAPAPDPILGPAVASETTCTGTATITIDPTPRGPLGLATARFDLDIRGCPPGTRITDAHIHQGPCCPNEIWIASGLSELPLPTGSARASSVNLGIALSRAEALIARPADFYLHFHSVNNPVGGFLRGDLRRK